MQTSQGVLGGVGAALSMAFAMGWEILWALVLGFTLSGVVQAAVTKGEMVRLLPDSSPRSILISGPPRPRARMRRSRWRARSSARAATVLNILFLILSIVLVWRFLRTGGPGMLRMMAAPADAAGEGHAGEAHHLQG